MTTHKDAIEMCIFHLLRQKKAYQKSSLHFIQSFFIQTIGVKIVETLLSFRVDFKLGAKTAPSPAPPGQCCVFLFSTSLVDSGTTLIRVGEGGVSRKRTFWTSFLCKQSMFRCQCALLANVSTNFVADCLFQKTSFIPFIQAPIVHSVCQYDHMSERLFTGLKNCG